MGKQTEASESQRRVWAAQSRANLAIEGMHPTSDSMELQEKWVRGEITFHDRRAILLKKYQEENPDN